MPETIPPHLPPYQVRVSKRARHVSIRISPRREVEVVVPEGYDASRVPAIIEKRRTWIARHLQRLQDEAQAAAAPAQEDYPTEIHLRAIAETWQVRYQATPEPQVVLDVLPNQQVTIVGAIAETHLCHQVLGQWLRQKARAHFTPWLRQVSHDIDLPYQRLTVRHQKTRWASCSSQRSISLNLKLLFLPPPLVRYVFIHELCHTVHMNHSADFWALVHEKDPHYKPLDQQLRKAWSYVPPWADV